MNNPVALVAQTDAAIIALQETLHTLAGALDRVETVSGGLLMDGDVFMPPGLWGLWASNLRAQLDSLSPASVRCHAAYCRFCQAYQTLAEQGRPDLVAPYGLVWETVTDIITDLIAQYARYEYAYHIGRYLAYRTPDAL